MTWHPGGQSALADLLGEGLGLDETSSELEGELALLARPA
jgi:hypothetical protein